MDKQVLTSSQASEDVSRYSVGILREGRYMHVYHFVQCRFYPTFIKLEQINKWKGKLHTLYIIGKVLILGICFYWNFFWELDRDFFHKNHYYLAISSYVDQGDNQLHFLIAAVCALCQWVPANCLFKLPVTNTGGSYLSPLVHPQISLLSFSQNTVFFIIIEVTYMYKVYIFATLNY